MATEHDLTALLERLDGRGYPAYKEIRGHWDFPGFRLTVDHVQGDPFAAPSRIRVELEPDTAAVEPWILERRVRRLGVAAWLARAFADAAPALGPGRGSGKSGSLAMASPGQLVLPQTAVRVHRDGTVEARFTVGLPARGRRIMGREAASLLGETVPEAVGSLLARGAHPQEVLRTAAEVNEDAESLREQLRTLGLVAFVADGAILPRRSGVDDRPLQEGAVPFRSPGSLQVKLEAPNAGEVRGMGIPEGVTLVVGGGFHGKSTLLRAVEGGVYNHRPGDGRERVVTVREAVKIRAEDGRSVQGVDISPFIGDLPGGQDTTRFTTPNASGSTSQAAALVEALEMGARALLVDEDTAATNFLIRDRRMQALVPTELEPITPMVDRVRDLHDQLGVSAVMVLGGSGDYLDVADTVIGMDAFRPLDLTERAREVARSHPTGRKAEPRRALTAPAPRTLRAASLPPGRRGRDLRVKTLEGRTLRVGNEILDLTGLEQLLIPTQLRTVAAALEMLAREESLSDQPLPGLLAALEASMEEELDRVSRWPIGALAMVRRFELAGALNRLRTLEVAS